MPACVDQELLLGGLIDNELDAANIAMVEAHVARPLKLSVADAAHGIRQRPLHCSTLRTSTGRNRF